MVGRNMAAMLGIVALLIAGSMNIPLRADPNDCETGCGVGATTGIGTRWTDQCLAETCYWRRCEEPDPEGDCEGWGCPNCVDACNQHVPCGELN